MQDQHDPQTQAVASVANDAGHAGLPDLPVPAPLQEKREEFPFCIFLDLFS